MGNASDRNEGQLNTKNLLNLIGSAAITGAFEKVVSEIKKTETGKENQPAFRLGDGGWNEAPMWTGDVINGSPAVGDCVKKNRYNLLQTTKTVAGGDTMLELSPFINDEDIVWFLPAVDQFSTLPSAVASSIVPGDCWSSTAVTDGENAYLGNGSTDERLIEHKVRAVRK